MEPTSNLSIVSIAGTIAIAFTLSAIGWRVVRLVKARRIEKTAHDVGALKEAQRRYIESERFLEQAEAVAGLGGFRIDLPTGARHWTRQTFKLFEIDGDVAPAPRVIAELLGADGQRQFSAAIDQAVESRTGYDLELAARTARGRPIWIRAIGLVECEAGIPVRIVGAIQDVTERKARDALFRTASERSTMATEAAEMGIWEWDLATNAQHWDDQMYRLYGASRASGDNLSEVWTSRIPVADRNRVDEQIRRAMQSGSKVESEFRVLLPTGEIRHLKDTAQIQRDAQGVAVRIIGVTFEVTELREAEQAMRDSEKKFRSLFELSPLGVAMKDPQSGRFLDVNAALVESTGFSREQLLTMTYFDITPVRFHAEEKATITSLHNGDHFGPFEKEYQRRDGSTFPALLSGIRTEDAAGRPLLWAIIQDISRRKAMESELADAARRDKLTGLANRALFMERLDLAVARVNHGQQAYFAVLFLDFDRFKLINDTLGHEAGDELLRQIAQRLRKGLRASDALALEETSNVVSRFGGDEFLLLINDIKAPSDAVRIAERLLNTLAAAYEISGTEVHSSASIGIVTSDRCCSSAEDIVRNADVAMYEAKQAGRAGSVVFDEAMHTRLARHVTIENSLRRAIGSAELSLAYQPIVDLESGEMVSAEALIRWNHPTLGPISPAEFIPIAEESALIIAVGQWVQDKACEAMARWRSDLTRKAPAMVSVNLSQAELALGDRLLEQVTRTLERHGLPPECLQLELTEREFMRHPAAAHRVLRSLQELGVRIAMDDFGTGTSSLGALRQYPFDTVKIDGSFMKDVTANTDVLAVMHATIHLIENLGMTSVAEAVEDAAQVALLQSLGCRYAQGYFFSRPISADALLSRERWDSTHGIEAESLAS